MSTISLNDFYFPINNKIEVPESSFDQLMKTKAEELKDNPQLQFLYSQTANKFRSALRVRYAALEKAGQIFDLVDKDIEIHKVESTYRQAVKDIAFSHETLFEKLSKRNITYPTELQEIKKIKELLQQPHFLKLSNETKNYFKIAHRIEANPDMELIALKLSQVAPYYTHLAYNTLPAGDQILQTSLKATLDLYPLSDLPSKDLKRVIKKLQNKCKSSDTKTSQSNSLVETSNLLGKLRQWDPKSGSDGDVWTDKNIEDHMEFIKLQKESKEHAFYDRLIPEFKKFDLTGEKRDKLMQWITIVALYQVADSKIADFLTGSEAFTAMNGVVHAYLGKVEDDTISTEEILPETRKIFDTWCSQGSNTPKSSPSSERRFSMLPMSPVSPTSPRLGSSPLLSRSGTMWINDKLANDIQI